MGSEKKKNNKKLGVCEMNVFCGFREHLAAWFCLCLQQCDGALLISKAKSQDGIRTARYAVTAVPSVRLRVGATSKMYLKKHLCRLG